MNIFIFLLLFGYGWASTLPNGCPSDIHIHMLLPHETDCDKFYQCVHGTKALRDCAPGTFFDERLQSCAWQNTVECPRPTTIRMTSTTSTRAPTSLESTTQEPTTQGPTTQEAITQEATTQESITQQSTTQISTITTTQKSIPDCPSDFDNTLKIPHEIDCNKKIKCRKGGKILMSCPITGVYLNLEVSIFKKLFKRKLH